MTYTISIKDEQHHVLRLLHVPTIILGLIDGDFLKSAYDEDKESMVAFNRWFMDISKDYNVQRIFEERGVVVSEGIDYTEELKYCCHTKLFDLELMGTYGKIVTIEFRLYKIVDKDYVLLEG